jgi:hypothetical protein
MRLLIVQTGNKRITRRINVATISCIESKGDEVIVYYADTWAKLSGGAPLADHICRELTTDKKIIDVRTTDFVEPAEISQEKIKA